MSSRRSSGSSSPSRPQRRTRWGPEQARLVLSRYAKEGGSLAEFAQREGYRLERLLHWQYLLGLAAPAPAAWPESSPELAAGSSASASCSGGGSTALFVPVRVMEPSGAGSVAQQRQGAAGVACALEVVLAGERRIRVSVGFDEATLYRLVQTLEGVDAC